MGDVVPQVRSTSGAALLAMARPFTDGEAFEVVEIDGRLVAFDEDGWDILPSLSYSNVVRGIAR